MDMQADATRTSVVANLRSKPSGRTMIKAPINPATVASQRQALTFSPWNTAAPMVANRGAVKLSAVASAMGIKDKARNQSNIATRPTSARNPCSPRRPVFKAPNPAVKTTAA